MNKLAIVTGASSGIGLAFARLLAADDYDLLLVARDNKALIKYTNELQKTYQINAEKVVMDLSKPNAANELWKKLNGRNPDVLINNAGFGDYAPVVEADSKKLTDMINLNITTLTTLSQQAAIRMKKQRSGNILNVASIAAFFPGPNMAVYYATKAYVLSFSEALSVELKTTGVKVTALCPGPTATHFQKTAHAENISIFQGKLPSAEEVAAYGYKAMKKGRVVAVPGLTNKLQSHAVLPRSWKRNLVNRIQNN